jgi:hypothetical protein
LFVLIAGVSVLMLGFPNSSFKELGRNDGFILYYSFMDDKKIIVVVM